MDSPTDVTFVLNSLQGGGAEKVFVLLGNELARRGYDIDIVLMQQRGPYLEDLSKDVNLVSLESEPLLPSIRPLRRYLKRAQPANICSGLHGDSFVTILAWRLASRKGKLVIVNNDMPTLVDTSDIREQLIRFSLQLFYRWPTTILAPSSAAAKDFKRSFTQREVTVIPNPVSIETIKTSAQEEPTPNWPATGQHTILSAGRLSDAKDYPTLIEAFFKVHDAIPDSELIILGEGPLKETLIDTSRKLQLEDTVHFPGFVPNPYPYMAMADVFVLSSKREAFGNVLVEAMACGTPVVSTDCLGGPSEIMNGGEIGPLVPVGDTDALAEAIRAQLHDPTAVEILLDRANDFDISLIADDYEDLFFSESGNSPKSG